ncbi:MAG: glycosyltransferase [Eubacteriales bacterium]|nr:glycosyltransferase [Eubacteriales bacterium]
MENQVKVSVIIPVYNAENYLRQNLNSILEQSLREIEVICVDDGSTDGSMKILREFEEKDKRVHVLAQKNQYAGVARNHGMSIAKGEYFVFFDADDFFDHTMLEEMYEACQKDHAQICVCDGRIYDDNTKEYHSVDYLLKQNDIPQIRPFSWQDMPEKIFNFTTSAPWNKMFERNFLEKEGLLFQELRRANDLFFCNMALAMAERITIVKKEFANYRRGQASLQQTKDDSPLDFYYAMQELKKGLQKAGIFSKVEKSFVNFCIGGCVYNLNTAKTGNGYSKIYHALRDEIFEELRITGHSSGYFYMKEYYDQMQDILSRKPEVSVFNQLKFLESKVDMLEKGLVTEESLFQNISLDGSIKVSVIIPVYNVQEFLVECVESVMEQTLHNIEIICVNDGSTDQSPEILQKLKQKDARIQIVDKENGGLSSARNMGMKAAKGEYILFLDSDDYLDRDALRVLYLYAKYYEVDEMFYGASVFFDTAELEEEHSGYSNYYTRKGKYPDTEIGRNMFVKLQQNGDFKPSACLQILRREFLEENQIIFYEGILHEDNLFTMQCISLAKRVRLLDRSFYKRRVRGGSIMTEAKGFRNAYGKFISVVEMLKFIDKYNLYEYSGFYMALMKQLSMLCDSASMDLSDIGNSAIMDYINQLDVKERSSYILLVTHLRDIRQRIQNREENAIREEKRDLYIQLNIAREQCERQKVVYEEKKEKLQKELEQEKQQIRNLEQKLSAVEKENKNLQKNDVKMQKKNEDLRKALSDTQNSLTFRLGSIFTIIPKKIRNLLRRG